MLFSSIWLFTSACISLPQPPEKLRHHLQNPQTCIISAFSLYHKSIFPASTFLLFFQLFCFPRYPAVNFRTDPHEPRNLLSSSPDHCTKATSPLYLSRYPAVSFRTGVHDPGIWLPLSARVTALKNRQHLSERSELCCLFFALSSLPDA